MHVSHMRHMSKDIFRTMSDEIKIQMLTNQLYVSISDSDDDSYQDVFSWLCANTKAPFNITKEVDKEEEITRAWIYFYEELDLVAFKLRWM